LQRAAIETTFSEIGRRFPERREAARKIVEQYQHASVTAKQILPQLRDGEATLLELWMLTRPK
jgi:hypothetical protein